MPSSQAAKRVEAIVDVVLLEEARDTEFDDLEPDDEPGFDEDLEPDFDFLMDVAMPDSAALDIACANAH
jgi:hypothetical protein